MYEKWALIIHALYLTLWAWHYIHLIFISSISIPFMLEKLFKRTFRYLWVIIWLTNVLIYLCTTIEHRQAKGYNNKYNIVSKLDLANK